MSSLDQEKPIEQPKSSTVENKPRIKLCPQEDILILAKTCNSKRIRNLKNVTFIVNAFDPISHNFVKNIYIKKISKINRIIWTQIWQYYRDRSRKSVRDTLKQNYSRTVRFTFFGLAQQQVIDIPLIH